MAIFVIFCVVLLSENKYDDDDDTHLQRNALNESVYLSYEKTYLSKDLRKGLVKQVNRLQRQ